ncbi:MAG: putative peptidoglycan glycosyltransferase FtsW [Candidatus Shapirobacteria bacterium]|nr:putative peptidoglycan glycosyltransferase FtsW [Candidatus Shapirobacteria bacterium]MDD4383269.1 putative peptidoglycan glycosyltransferase FtsW [Candidatus Shapirobacteria bacterium]
MKENKSPLLFLVFSLVFIGLIFISISSLGEASSSIGDKFFYIKKQGFWLVLGIISFYVTSKINIKTIKKFSFALYAISILGLILVLIPSLGNEALGARRWLNLGFTSIQPSEILKLTSIIYFSSLFSKKENLNIKNLIFYLGLPFILIIIEPNLSTAILISAIVSSIYYLSGGDIVPLFSIFSIILVISIPLIFLSPYRSARLKTFLEPQQNQETSSYHSNQIILTLSSGGFFGKGFANSDQKYKFLPKISTDSILAVIGEEVGFIGIFAVLLVYLSLINYLLRFSQTIDDPFQSLIVSGSACWIAYQSLINISAITALIPLTGVTLPFISYGGSSLITLFIVIGLVRNIEKNQKILLYSKSEQSKKDDNNHRNTLNSSTRTHSSTES